ncbi:hypothetical protein GGR50DRAFT_217323 [Xylaria sp. CBS 124048]|nr:hypothetical protein GGR50DRAFT_217323 [Xylaria sp. CBS 124048]
MKTTSLSRDTSRSIKSPKRHDERIILHFDYDCFYASVFENEDPSLKTQALGVKQKSILATCNYVARARGVRKLMLISEAQRVCPDLILANGEDLTRFRDVSKRLWTFLRAHAWGDRVERLGLDEVFLDVTAIVSYNRELLNAGALRDSFFQLDRNDPVRGFAFDGSRFHGCVEPAIMGEAVEVDVADPLCVRLMLASHLAGYLRRKLDEDFGYTSSGGIATSKLLAKLAGSVNKPNNQTTLLLRTNGQADGVAEAFMDAHSLRKVPGIGSRTAQLIEEYLLSRPTKHRDHEGGVTVGEVRQHPGISPELLDQILDRPGTERGSGDKVWNLLHGVDPSEVKEASDVPTQISIEDTYMTRPLQTQVDILRELRALATSLIRRMRVDLTSASTQPPRWLAHPRTLRLSTRTKPKSSTSEAQNYARSSRSMPLPNFVFQLAPSSAEEIAERLVTEALLPLFRRLHPERNGGWNIALLNVCVANMAVAAAVGDTKMGVVGVPGRDIGRMFRTQEQKLREWTVYESPPAERVDGDRGVVDGDLSVDSSSTPDVDDEVWEESDSQCCPVCGHGIPAFAMAAHERFHAMGE